MLYFVSAEPPLLAGADHDNDTNPFPAAAESPDGAPETLGVCVPENGPPSKLVAALSPWLLPPRRRPISPLRAWVESLPEPTLTPFLYAVIAEPTMPILSVSPSANETPVL